MLYSITRQPSTKYWFVSRVEHLPHIYIVQNKMKIEDIEHLASLLAISKYKLTQLIFQSDYYYKEFKIRKNSGFGSRIICSPSKELKGVQRWISSFILEKMKLLECCTAYRKGYSIINNAEIHLNCNWVYNIDLEDFFPSITTKRVLGLFKSLKYPKSVAFAFSKICTYKGKLPQGAPTSPLIANLIARKLDRRLMGLCKSLKINYSRYSDDLTFSGNNGCPPDKIIKSIIKEEGFKVNKKKERICRKHNRQIVTGLIVNDKINIPRINRKKWRTIFHQAQLHPNLFKIRLSELQGIYSYFKMVDKDSGQLARYTGVIERLKLSN